MNEEEVKRAFAKVKEDISYLISEISSLKYEIHNLKSALDAVSYNPTQDTQSSTNQQSSPTFQNFISNKPTDILPSQSLKPENFNISIGNEGVPTNRQTDQQTNQHSSISTPNTQFLPSEDLKDHSVDIQKVSKILDSLDSIKRDLRLKFKRLTKQELLIFSAIYSSEEELEEVSYTSLAKKLSLSESSIRDYTIKLIKKGIPIIKEKLDNKRIILHISPELRKIASLDTIIKLREI